MGNVVWTVRVYKRIGFLRRHKRFVFAFRCHDENIALNACAHWRKQPSYWAEIWEDKR